MSMKASEIIGVLKEYLDTELRLIIREEIASQINNVGSIGHDLIETNTQKEDDILAEMETIESESNTIKFAQNAELNKILQEAYKADSIKTLQKKIFSSKDVHTLGLPKKDNIPHDKRYVEIPDFLKNALNKDYGSEVRNMKKIDKKYAPDSI